MCSELGLISVRLSNFINPAGTYLFFVNDPKSLFKFFFSKQYPKAFQLQVKEEEILQLEIT